MAVLTLGHLHYDWQQPDLPPNDHLIFSKGHASPLLYSMFRAAGMVDEKHASDHAPVVVDLSISIVRQGYPGSIPETPGNAASADGRSHTASENAIHPALCAALPATSRPHQRCGGRVWTWMQTSLQ